MMNMKRPLPQPQLLQCTSSPQANFSVCAASGMDGMCQMLHKAFISLRRLRARRIHLLLLGPLPQASGGTVNWAQQEK